MDESGIASLGFNIVCVATVMLFFGILVAPLAFLIYSLTTSAKQEVPENTQEDPEQPSTPEVPVENTKEAAIARLEALGVNIRSDVVVNKG